MSGGILHGFDTDGNFVAVDTTSHAAERGYKGSHYWRQAKDDPKAAAAEMIRATVAFRDEYPDMPSHQAEVWNANFYALAQLIGRS